MLSLQKAQKITLQFLIQKYGTDTGVKLLQEHAQDLFTYHGLAWTLGKENFKYFCSIFLYDLLFNYEGDNVPLSKTHYQIWTELQDLILNRKNTKNVYIFSRGFGKTTTISIPIAIYTALYCFRPFVVLGSATERQAENFVSTIKAQLENNPLITSCFGEVINKELKYNAQEIELDIKPERSKIQAVSTTSSTRGITYHNHRVGLLILDDFQDEKQLTSDKACIDLVTRTHNGIFKTLQSKKNNVIAVGTIQRKGDLYDTFINSPVWTAKTEKCVMLDDIDSYFANNSGWQKINSILRDKSNNPYALMDAENYYEEHKDELQFPVIWNNFDCFELAKEYFEDSVSFKRERQCDINSLGEKRIKSICEMPESEIEQIQFTNTILSVDPAATTNQKSDYSAFCVLSDTDSHIKYARKCVIDRLDFDSYINYIIFLLRKYPDIQTISIEKQVYMGADVIKLREKISMLSDLCSRPLNIVNKSRTKNKDARINAVIPDINMSRIIFNENDVEAIEQIKSFCGTAYTLHDDMIDALADAAENITQIEDTLPELQVLDWSRFGL